MVEALMVEALMVEALAFRNLNSSVIHGFQSHELDNRIN